VLSSAAIPDLGAGRAIRPARLGAGGEHSETKCSFDRRGFETTERHGRKVSEYIGTSLAGHYGRPSRFDTVCVAEELRSGFGVMVQSWECCAVGDQTVPLVPWN
jgi:hypothetical protein